MEMKKCCQVKNEIKGKIKNILYKMNKKIIRNECRNIRKDIFEF